MMRNNPVQTINPLQNHIMIQKIDTMLLFVSLCSLSYSTSLNHPRQWYLLFIIDQVRLRLSLAGQVAGSG